MGESVAKQVRVDALQPRLLGAAADHDVHSRIAERSLRSEP